MTSRQSKSSVSRYDTELYTSSWGGTRTRDPGIMSSGAPSEQIANLGLRQTTTHHRTPRSGASFSARDGANCVAQLSVDFPAPRPPPRANGTTVAAF